MSLRRTIPFYKRRQGGSNLGKEWFFPTTKPSALTYRAIATNGSRVVIGADGGTNPVAYSDDDGTNWTNGTADNRRIQSIAYSPSLDLFCAVAIDGTGRALSSSDGITWTTRTTASRVWTGITWGNGIFVAVGGVRLMTSSNGTAWTERASMPVALNKVVWVEALSIFVGVGNNVSATSSDGISWTAGGNLGGINSQNINVNGPNIVAYDGNNNTSISAYSTNGTSWTLSSLSSVSAFGWGGAFALDKFFAFRLNDIRFSIDNGINWDNTGVINPTDQGSTYWGAIFTGTRLIALNNGTEFIILSE